MAVVHGQPSQALSRRFAAGIIALRPDRDGAIAGYDGLERGPAGVRRVDHRLPPAARGHADAAGRGRLHGQRVDPACKHPDYDHLREMLDAVGRTVKVRAR